MVIKNLNFQKSKIIILFFICSLVGCKNNNPFPYKSISIGGQIWMGTNLDVATFRNGDTIPLANNMLEWEALCISRKPARYELIFSKLDYLQLVSTVDSMMHRRILNDLNIEDSVKLVVYNDYAISDKRKIAPIGWRIPTENDWKELLNYVGWISIDNNSEIDKSDNIFINQIPSFSIFDNQIHINDSISHYWAKDYSCKNKFRNNYELILGINLSTNNKVFTNFFKDKEVSYNHGIAVRCIKGELDSIAKNSTLKSIYQDTILIGNKIWYNEDLDVEVFRNGDSIPLAYNLYEWEKLCINREPARYEIILSTTEYLEMFADVDSAFLYRIASLNEWDLEQNQDIKLVVYNKYAIDDNRNLLPYGWSFPTTTDWNELLDYIGCDSPSLDDRPYKGWRAKFQCKPSISIIDNKIKKSLYTISYWVKDSPESIIKISPTPNYEKKTIFYYLNSQEETDMSGFAVRCFKNLDKDR